MSYRDRTDPDDGGWAGLAEWTGGLPPEQIRALAAVRPFEAVHSLLRGLAGRTPRELLARAAVLEALASSGADLDPLIPSPLSPVPGERETNLDTAPDPLAWLAEPARGETLSALHRSGWLEPGPDGTFSLTVIGRQVWDVLRRAAFPEARSALPLLPAGITPEQIVRALLTRSVEELAAAGRNALVPILPAPPLLTTEGVARAAEVQAREGDTGRAEPGRPAGGRRK